MVIDSFIMPARYTISDQLNSHYSLPPVSYEVGQIRLNSIRLVGHIISQLRAYWQVRIIERLRYKTPFSYICSNKTLQQMIAARELIVTPGGASFIYDLLQAIGLNYEE